MGQVEYKAIFHILKNIRQITNPLQIGKKKNSKRKINAIYINNLVI